MPGYKLNIPALLRATATLVLAASAAGIAPASAGTLPDDRADLMYHRYDGGGVTIDGPSLLVRKKFQEKYAVNASYYVDLVSSASIDVVTTASPYAEKRKQYGVGAEYLRGKTTYSLDYSNSRENDYDADTASASISQDMFGDLTTLRLSFARGWDTVRRRGDTGFARALDRRVYGVDLSQVATSSLILGLSWEAFTEEGFLNNPYRSVRFLDEGSSVGYSYEPERYPGTRTGNAVGLRARQFLPWRAALQGDYRWYTDTWDVRAHTFELAYTQPWRTNWTFDVHYRYYTQLGAEFYSDLFPRADYANFIGRDKELSTFASNTLGFGVAYEFRWSRLPWLARASVNLKYDRMEYDYKDFRDVRVTTAAPGTEPLYGFGANVVQVFVSGWF